MRQNVGRALAMFLVGLCALLGGSALAQVGVWTARAPIPTARLGPASGVIGGKLYVASGGCPSPTCVATAPYPRFSGLEIYDPQTNSWTAGAPIPIAIYGAASAVVDGKLYVAGGQGQNGVDDTGVLQIYDAATDSWSFGASMPLRGSQLAGASLDGKFYVAGNVPYLSGAQALRAYDPVTNTWQLKASMPTGRAAARAVAVNGLLYVVGGWNGAAMTTVEVYDPATNSWQPRTPMPTPRANLSIVARDGIIYAIGGDNNAQAYNVVEAYDPVSDAWAAFDPMPAGHSHAAAGLIDDTLHVVSGFDGATGFNADNHAFAFSSAPPDPPSVSVLISQLSSVATSYGLSPGVHLLENARRQAAGGQTRPACNMLMAFANQVRAQTGKRITAAQAAELIAAADVVRGALGCQ